MIVESLTMVEDVIPLLVHAMVAIQILDVIISMTLIILINVNHPIAHAFNAIAIVIVFKTLKLLFVRVVDVNLVDQILTVLLI